MSDESPNTTRPRHYPEDLRDIVAEALPKIADELEALKFLASNSGLETLKEIGDLKFAFESWRDRILESMALNDAGHSKTQLMLTRLLSETESAKADFEAFQEKTNDAIGELRRRINSTNGSSNGSNGAHLY